MNQPLGSEVSGPAEDWSTSSGRPVGRSVCRVDEGKTGGQAATQGCELTVVLPSFHCMSRPSLGRSRQQVAKRPLLCGGTGQESREGLVSVHLPGHVNARGSFRLLFSHCTTGDWLRTCASASLPVTGSHPPAGRGWGQERKRLCPPESPYPGCYPSA